MGPFIRLRSDKFPILPGEADELVNEGMYGKALALYLAERLQDRGYPAADVCCEDWGWWVGLAGFEFPFGACVYGRALEDGTLDLYVTDAAVSERRWSWRRLRFEQTGARQAAGRLHADLLAIFSADPDVQVLATDLDSPFVD